VTLITEYLTVARGQTISPSVLKFYLVPMLRLLKEESLIHFSSRLSILAQFVHFEVRNSVEVSSRNVQNLDLSRLGIQATKLLNSLSGIVKVMLSKDVPSSQSDDCIFPFSNLNKSFENNRKA
jgi:hypothetical protein